MPLRGGESLTVDLETQQVTGPGELIVPFEFEAFARESLLQGLDDIALTLKREEKIAAFEQSHSARCRHDVASVLKPPAGYEPSTRRSRTRARTSANALRVSGSSGWPASTASKRYFQGDCGIGRETSCTRSSPWRANGSIAPWSAPDRWSVTNEKAVLQSFALAVDARVRRDRDETREGLGMVADVAARSTCSP